MWKFSRTSNLKQTVKALQNFKQTGRFQQSQAPLPTSRSSGGLLLKVLGGTGLVCGGTLAGAYYEPRFRRVLEDTPLKPLLDAVLPQEIKEALKSGEHTQTDDPSNALSNVQQVDLVQQTQSVATAAEKTQLKKRAAEERLTKERLEQERVETERLEKERREAERLEEERREAERLEQERAAEELRLAKEQAERERQEAEVEQQRLLKEAEEAAENLALESMLAAASETSKELVQSALEKLYNAVEASKEHMSKLQGALQDELPLEKEQQWSETAVALEKRQKASEVVEEAVQAARNKLEELEAVVSEGTGLASTASNEQLVEARDQARSMKERLDEALLQLKESQQDELLVETLGSRVEQAKQQFLGEIQAVSPSLKLERGLEQLSESELGTLLAHAHLRLQQLHHQVQNHEQELKDKVQRTIEEKLQSEELVSSEHAQQKVNRAREQIQQEQQAWMQEHVNEAEAELRKQLTRQTAAHQDHLSQALVEQESVLQQRYDLQLEQTVVQERQLHEQLVQEYSGRLEAIRSAVDTRAEVELQSRQAQELWMACLALQQRIRCGNREAEDHEDTRSPLSLEVEAVRAAAGANLQPLLSALDTEALEKGVATERELRYRFYQVARTCKRVALVPEGSGSLARYLLSMLQSLFVFESVQALSEEDTVPSDDMSCFQLLAHAKHCIAADNLEQATRYMNQLQGEAAFVARDWLRDARLLLETRQTAEAMAACSTGSAVGTLLALGLKETSNHNSDATE